MTIRLTEKQIQDCWQVVKFVEIANKAGRAGLTCVFSGVWTPMGSLSNPLPEIASRKISTFL